MRSGDIRLIPSGIRGAARLSGNIFLDQDFPPYEAEVMLARARLAAALRKWIEREGLTQAQASRSD
jgi:predicted XRE-type DNA-binding protein